MKLWLHKLKNWEYWPEYIIYSGTLIYWIGLAIKYKSITFYKYANPSIKNGGLYGDKKMDIYKLLPKKKYPRSYLIDKCKEYNFKELIEYNNFIFPLILKPNIGLRGIDVVKVNNIQEIYDYQININKNFIIQEYINLKNEISIFYYRMPDKKNGKITGITIKEFLTIKGDGNKSIEQHLKENFRYEMQIDKLKKSIDLKEIISKNEIKCIVPFGNHNRGTKFTDGKEFITDKLQKTFNNYLSKVKGFYYGRLDIKYNTIEELENGENFYVIELNGAKSEPSHIYDPKHSFWYGQKEIYKHQKIMSKIIDVNINNKN